MFIALEGIDGAGKSSLADAIAGGLTERGVPARAVHKRAPLEPGGGPWPEPADRLAGLIWDPASADAFGLMGPHFWAHLMAAWFHSVHRLSVAPLLASGHVVVVDSWAAKFAAKLAVHERSTLPAALGPFASLPAPDLVLFVDVAPETAFARRSTVHPAEAGNAGGEPTAAQFRDFQRHVAGHLAAYAGERAWPRVPNETSVGAATAVAVEHVLSRLRATLAG